MAEQREAGVGFIGKFAAGSRLPSLDDSIRLKQERLRDGEAERLRRLEVDRQFELRRLLDREVSGLRAFQDPIDVDFGSPTARATTSRTACRAARSVTAAVHSALNCSKLNISPPSLSLRITPAVSSRGERTRASGLLDCAVEQLL